MYSDRVPYPSQGKPQNANCNQSQHAKPQQASSQHQRPPQQKPLPRPEPPQQHCNTQAKPPPHPPPKPPKPNHPPQRPPETNFVNRILESLHLGDLDSGDLLLLGLLFFLWHQKADEELLIALGLLLIL